MNLLIISSLAVLSALGVNHLAAVSNYRARYAESTPGAETQYFLGQILKLGTAIAVIVVLLKAIS